MIIFMRILYKFLITYISLYHLYFLYSHIYKHTILHKKGKNIIMKNEK